MPHDVIMPALGMAQDTGLLVNWLKAPGDAVRAGDPLFEVETDKSTMEVEAPTDGYLTDIQVFAGAKVPVGQVIAMISDTAVDSRPPPAAKPDAPQPMAVAVPPAGFNVIMPVLGMAQDSGLLVTWHKEPGDAVGAEDVLFEVETDKSTMEVPAGADGFVAALLAIPGDEVPTGQTIAIITNTKPEAGTIQPMAKPEPKADDPAVEKQVQAAPCSPSAPSAGAVSDSGRILASPKARRLALEAGLDLQRLVSAGHPQPFHAADIAVLRNLPEAGRTIAAEPAGRGRITALAPRAGTDEFLAWMLEDGGITIAPAALWVSFAAGALRAALPDCSDLTVSVSTLAGTGTTLMNPDRTRLLHQIETPDATADLILRDLTGTPITSLQLGPQPAPVLCLASDGDTLRLSLDFTSDQLEDTAAIALISGFATRLTDPLHHLL